METASVAAVEAAKSAVHTDVAAAEVAQRVAHRGRNGQQLQRKKMVMMMMMKQLLQLLQ